MSVMKELSSYDVWLVNVNNERVEFVCFVNVDDEWVK